MAEKTSKSYIFELPKSESLLKVKCLFNFTSVALEVGVGIRTTRLIGSHRGHPHSFTTSVNQVGETRFWQESQTQGACWKTDLLVEEQWFWVHLRVLESPHTVALDFTRHVNVITYAEQYLEAMTLSRVVIPSFLEIKRLLPCLVL